MAQVTDYNKSRNILKVTIILIFLIYKIRITFNTYCTLEIAFFRLNNYMILKENSVLSH